jgi:heme a synthase
MTLFYLELVGIILLCSVVPIGIFIYKYTRVKSNNNVVDNINYKIKHFIWLLIILTFELILFGAFTRLSDSGLGCPDWPGCFAQSNPFSAHHAIQHAELLNPLGAVTKLKAWIEMVHRYIAGTLGFLVIVLNIIVCLNRKHTRIRLRYTLFILFLIILQGTFGAWTVTLKLQPIIVSTHLLLALIFICSLVALYAHCTKHAQPAQYTQTQHIKINTKYIWLTILLIFIQIALGAWVSSNYAMLGCTEFPSCSKSMFLPNLPLQIWQEAFYLWRDLGLTKQGNVLSLDVLTAIHLTHRYMAIFVFIICMFMFRYLLKKLNIVRNENNKIKDIMLKHHRKIVYYAISILILQILTGISTVIFSLPMLTVLIHTGGATLLISMLVYFAVSIKN